MWAEAGDFRDNTHSAMSAIPSSMDHHSQLSFQASNASRGRSRDRKADGELTNVLSRAVGWDAVDVVAY